MDEEQTIAATSVLVTFRDVLVHARRQGIPVAMAPLQTKEEILAWQLRTHGGTKAYWPPDPAYAMVRYEPGVLPPPMHMW